MSKIARLSLLIGLSIVGGSACLTGRAQTPAERPALDVPAPPDRVVPHVPPPEPPLPAIEPVEDLASGTKPAPPTRNKPAATRPPQDPPKPESKPDPPATETPPPQTPPPAPQLKLPENADAGVMSRQIRDTIERTRRMLSQTDRAKLSSRDRQKAFDDAHLFMKQAEDAVNTKNLVFAKELADKAERLAKEVQNR